MRAMVTKYDGAADGFTGLITRSRALRLKGLAKEAYQPEQYAIGLSSEEAARRIDALKAESIPSR
jgi:hypothetical protein